MTRYLKKETDQKLKTTMFKKPTQQGCYERGMMTEGTDQTISTNTSSACHTVWHLNFPVLMRIAHLTPYWPCHTQHQSCRRHGTWY